MSTEERLAQADYEKSMAASKSKRALDASRVAELEGQKSNMETVVHNTKEKLRTEVINSEESTAELKNMHADCDSLLKKYELVKQARQEEREAIAKAAAVLNGAKFDDN